MTTIFELAAKLQAAGAIEAMLLVIVKATLILAIARLMLMAMPRASAAARHMVATAALVAVAAMPVMSVVIPAWNIVVEKPAVAAAQNAAETSAARTVGATDAEENETPATTAPASGATIGTAISLAKATGVVPDEPLSAMSRAMNITQSTWKGMIALAIGTVTLLMLAQMLVGMVGVWHVSKNAEELTQDAALVELDNARDALALGRDVKLLRSSRISVPVLWGVFKPVLLLPADVVTWPVERLRVVLMHELAHLKRFDGISLIATRIAVSIFWYHPLAWSLERAGRSECERSCDDLVLAAGTKPSEYADHLLAIARSMPTFDPFRSVTLAMSRKSQLEGRLLSILQPHVVRRAFTGRGVAVACALAVAVIIPVSALRLTAEPQQGREAAFQTAQLEKKEQQQKTDASVTVTPDVEAIENYFLAKLGKYDKRADNWMREPKNAEDWYDRAYDLYRNDRFEDAAPAFVRAAELGHKPATSLYNAACSWALLGDARRATEMLAKAINAGWDDFDHIADDSDFDPIRGDAAFQRLVAQGGSDVANRRVTETMERFKQLEKGGATYRKSGDHSYSPRDVEAIVEGVVGGIADGIADGIAQGAEHGGNVGKHLGKSIGKRMEDVFHGGNDWAEVGVDLLRLRKFDESIKALENAVKQGEKVGTSMYNLACAYSLKGDARNGMLWLDKSIENGFSSEEKFLNDPDIALLRKQAGFMDLVQKAADLEMKGCCDDEWDDEDDRSQWRRVAAHHNQIVQKYPQSGRAWFNLGFTALQARDFQTGQNAFQKAISLGYRTGTSSYNIACGYALQNNREAAFQWLNKARAEGFDLRGYLFSDDDLDSLHKDPRFEALADEVDAKRMTEWKWKSEKKRK
jgi:beta-lactamase regulating signal transducer with metallopeptidase domain/tetratricopeptide (TPR) repeat protein